VLGRLISFNSLTFEEEKQAMVDVGVPEAIAEMNAQALSLFAQGDSDWVADDVMSILGRPARTFEEFATDNALLLRQARATATATRGPFPVLWQIVELRPPD
jgi:hypothetical protein